MWTLSVRVPVDRIPVNTLYRYTHKHNNHRVVCLGKYFPENWVAVEKNSVSVLFVKRNPLYSNWIDYKNHFVIEMEIEIIDGIPRVLHPGLIEKLRKVKMIDYSWFDDIFDGYKTHKRVLPMIYEISHWIFAINQLDIIDDVKNIIKEMLVTRRNINDVATAYELFELGQSKKFFVDLEDTMNYIIDYYQRIL